MTAEDHEETTSELARRALLLRDGGATYEGIGETLGFSGGKAHHLVRAAHEDRVDLANELARPPGKSRPSEAGRAANLLGRLTLDLGRVIELLDAHGAIRAEPPSGGQSPADLRLSFIEHHRLLGELVDAGSGPRAAPDRKLGARACRVIARSFSGLLEQAAELDPTLRGRVGTDYVAAAFRRDLHELAGLLELAVPAGWDGPIPDRGGEPESEPAEAIRPPLDAAARRRRDEQIVAERLGGASAAAIAEQHQLSQRQVGRIITAHRDAQLSGGPSAVAAAHAAVEAMVAGMGELEERINACDDPKERRRRPGRRAGHGLHVEAVQARRAARSRPGSAPWDGDGRGHGPQGG